MENKILKATMMTSGIVAILFIGNFLVHFLFYLIDGALEKFGSATWLGLNAVMLLSIVVFISGKIRTRGLSI
jgi:hypothetical protein